MRRLPALILRKLTVVRRATNMRFRWKLIGPFIWTSVRSGLMLVSKRPAPACAPWSTKSLPLDRPGCRWPLNRRLTQSPSFSNRITAEAIADYVCRPLCRASFARVGVEQIAGNFCLIRAAQIADPAAKQSVRPFIPDLIK
mmetsp:Transcript_28649/g.54025  ORF Transcript_28649/g.54025 Transcript_28649/m.54025 type:complete len:141 (+) Transcript_28649:664-1086(+)